MNEELNDYSLSNLQQKHNIIFAWSGHSQKSRKRKQEMAIGLNLL